MCLGIPGQIVAVGDSVTDNVQVEVCRVRGDWNIALV